ncbi:MAG: hypothetical protein ACRCU2_06355 [Planktothrix sp.]
MNKIRDFLQNNKNHNSQPQSRPPFQEPEIKKFNDFISYCFIFDPTISMQSGRVIEQAELMSDNFSLRDELIMYLFNNSFDIECAIQNIEDLKLFICDAPSYSDNQKNFFPQSADNYLLGKSKLNPSWKEIKNGQIHSLKTYACCRGSFENESFQRWIVMKTPPKNTDYADSPEDMMGYGNTLLEADLNFYKARIKSFTNSQEIINKVIDNKTPLTKQKMLETCQKIDPLVTPGSVTFTYFEQGFFYVEATNFKLSCESENYKFTLEFLEGDITWYIIKLLKIDHDNFPVTIEFLGEGKTLEETLKMCDLEYQEFINDDETMAEIISSQREQEERRQDMIDNVGIEDLL